MVQHTLSLGIPGDLIFPGSTIDERASHIGGNPTCPAGVDSPDHELLKCKICGEILDAVLSLFVSSRDAPDASTKGKCSIQAYGCTREGCGKELGSWRALRCEWPVEREASIQHFAETSLLANRTFAFPQSSDLTEDSWGLDAPIDSKADANANTTSSSSTIDFGDLAAALDTLHHQQGLGRRDEDRLPNPAETTGRTSLLRTKSSPLGKEENIAPSHSLWEPSKPCLPAFFLVQTEENPSPPPSLSAHVQDLLAKYQTSEILVPPVVSFGSTSEQPHGSLHMSRGEEAKAAGESSTWDGEGYEPDAVLAISGRSAPGRGFLKFLKQLQLSPEQCTRRGGGDEPLWPLDGDPPRPTPCGTCGAQRVLQVQLMAPLIAALEESMEWLEAEGLDKCMMKLPPSSWEWSTIVIYTCSARCGELGTWVEEEVVLVGED